MASGRRHDRSTGLLALPFGLLCWPATGPAGVLVGAAAFLVGGLWLSPDLDTRSNPTRRWGPLAWLWAPYRRLLRHRSLLSHAPLLGTTGRLLYLGALALLLAALLPPFGAPAPRRLLEGLAELARRQRPLLLVALAGLEASCWLHLLLDGDPLPRTPRLLRGVIRRRRSRMRR